MKVEKVALIGCGAWGKNYLRILQDMRVEFSIYDPAWEHSRSLDDTVDWCDVAIVASPASTHAEVACSVMEAGKPVLVEKPMATSVIDVDRMIQVSRDNKAPLLVGHVFLHHQLPNITASGKMFAVWSHKGREREDVSVWWDMAPHPLSLMGYFAGQKAIDAHLENGTLVVEYPSCRGSVVASWGLQRERKLSIEGDTYDVVFDFDKQPTGTVEPLRRQVHEFFRHVTFECAVPMGCRPEDGREVVRILEMAKC